LKPFTGAGPPLFAVDRLAKAETAGDRQQAGIPWAAGIKINPAPPRDFPGALWSVPYADD
jgi:hypothetical protein